MSNPIARLGWLAVAAETTPGTAATAPTLFIPTKASVKRQKKRVYGDEDRFTRDVNNVVADTTRFATVTLKSPWYNDSTAYFLYHFMGADAVTGATPSYTHALTLADVPGSFTMWREYNVAAYQFPYGVVEKMSLDFTAADKVVEADVTAQSYFGTKVVTNTFTPVFTTLNPMAAWNTAIKINNVASTVVEDLKVDLSQKVTPYFTAGSQDPIAFDFADRDAKIEFTARFDDTSILAYFDSTPGTDIALTTLTLGDLLGGTTYNSLALDFPIVGFDEIDVDASKEVIVIKAKCTARPGATKNSLFTATVVNGVAAYA